MERFQMILEISANADGPVKSADEIEGLLIQEMRPLGNTTLGSWAASAERRLAEQLKQKDSSARARTKKTAEVVECFRAGQCAGVSLAHRPEEVSALAARRHRCESARSFATFGAGADGFWLRAFLCARGSAGAGTLRF
jgi:hypothetical protein